MFLSVFDIFKIGIGPSSSHTMGPMVAAGRFLSELRARLAKRADCPARLHVTARLYGSLAFTGHGHGSDRAVMLGLMGYLPDSLDPDLAEGYVAELIQRGEIVLPGLPPLSFSPDTDLVFDYGPPLPAHPNGMVIAAHAPDGATVYERIYYSVGGGFVRTAEGLEAERTNRRALAVEKSAQGYPYPFGSAAEMLKMGAASGLSVAQMKRANETVMHGDTLDARLDTLWAAMSGCIDRGLRQEGELPGGLKVRRRARAIHQQLLAERGLNSAMPHVGNDWLAVYAMAVNEENAAGGRVVTSPTNGAAGVLPAVIRYYRDHCPGATDLGIRDFLLTAAAIGGVIKHNASISGAEVGCQGEVGSASAMAAAGLCAVLGGSNAQIENAAEIALEHHLGLTCDPVKGLVQVPCIERNGLGAIKAVSAASLALRGNGEHFVPLDNCIETMRQTGIDMNVKYKETSTGGLAVNLPEC
ncbi:L-serine ammonia-lyase [Actibacterium sp. XHP0104]|uniref:L-serine ammonia-lyase n=1 Tax=Actibacterium sp. XHP0104 TaxID=2984335 RepID=UPI0021E853C0|nr:L-serine ammonia-lyase [Actibacterium sp. XHP0104]MCV2881452.1 L-serine ammonia-lyase [Actibacterium sp. XHP0104]